MAYVKKIVALEGLLEWGTKIPTAIYRVKEEFARKEGTASFIAEYADGMRVQIELDDDDMFNVYELDPGIDSEVSVTYAEEKNRLSGG